MLRPGLRRRRRWQGNGGCRRDVLLCARPVRMPAAGRGGPSCVWKGTWAVAGLQSRGTVKSQVGTFSQMDSAAAKTAGLPADPAVGSRRWDREAAHLSAGPWHCS